MRIAFLGKGGSGKTTIASGFISYIAKSQNIVAIDADHNANLQLALGIQGRLFNLADHSQEIRDYLSGNRKDLEDTTVIDTTPPSLQSNFINNLAGDRFMSKYAQQKDRITLYAVGTYDHNDKAVTCYHGKLGILSNILSHTLDDSSQYIVVDSTAGKDTIGTSLYFAYDLTIFVVEPTVRSINVYKEYKKIVDDKYSKIFVVINKYEDSDAEFVQNNIDQADLLGVINHDSKIRNIDSGNQDEMNYLITRYGHVFAEIDKKLKTTNRDWNSYYANLLEAHKKLSQEWYDAFYNQPVSKQLDPDFSYHKVLNQL